MVIYNAGQIRIWILLMSFMQMDLYLVLNTDDQFIHIGIRDGNKGYSIIFEFLSSGRDTLKLEFL